jgi:hypothetical protein
MTTIRLAEHLSYYHNEFAKYEQVIFDGDQIENLKTVLQRALNTWPEAPKELFDLDQILRFGEVLQPTTTPLFPASPKS